MEYVYKHMDWSNVEVLGRNRLPVRPFYCGYPNKESARQGRREECSNYRLLNGQWKFAYYESPFYVPDTCMEKEYDDREFGMMPVPGHWQLNGYDYPHYNDAIALFPILDGIQADNPTGVYRYTFQEEKQKDREYILRFDGVESAYHVWLNGTFIGYSQGPRNTAEFDVTEALQDGENVLAVIVYKFSDGSYLENQDFIQLSGIMRDIYLYSKDSRAELRDFFVQTSFADRTDKNSDVTMKVDVDVRNLTDKEDTSGYTVDVKLKDMDGKVIGQDTISYDKLKALQGVTGASDPNAADADGEKKVNLGDRKTATIEVKNPKKWFPDTPNLYMVTLELKDSTGKVIEAEAEHVGFREIYKVNINDAEQEQMQITGQKIIFRGVNRHDTSLENGSAVTNQEIIDDLKLMKQYNVNAVRTSHYPNAKILYDLADELGIYVYAEANVESHYGAYGDHKVPIPGGDSRWVTPVVDRNMNMLELLKNHASIIGWSYGNEATYTRCPLDNTYCFWAAAMAVLNRDPSRLRMYERESDGYYHRYQKERIHGAWRPEARTLWTFTAHSIRKQRT